LIALEARFAQQQGNDGRAGYRKHVKVEEMQLNNGQSTLTTDERSQKRKLVVRDTVALLTLLAVTLVLFTATVFLFRAFSNLRDRLAERWLARGEAALQSGNPSEAVEYLRSALAYAPARKDIEIDLAEALAGAGRTQEATSYFTTLWEAEPGSSPASRLGKAMRVKRSNAIAPLFMATGRATGPSDAARYAWSSSTTSSTGAALPRPGVN
jgi:tetratricopeptide (TPR) repeat protein